MMKSEWTTSTPCPTNAAQPCVSAFCGLCGVPTCLTESSYPGRLEGMVDWTHDLVYRNHQDLGFALHKSCWGIFMQEYTGVEGPEQLSMADLILSIRDRLRPMNRSANPFGQVPFQPTWCDHYANATSGKGPIDARFPDGWVDDLTMVDEDSQQDQSHTNTMDFLLVDPLEKKLDLPNGRWNDMCSKEVLVNEGRIRTSANSLAKAIVKRRLAVSSKL